MCLFSFYLPTSAESSRRRRGRDRPLTLVVPCNSLACSSSLALFHHLPMVMPLRGEYHSRSTCCEQPCGGSIALPAAPEVLKLQCHTLHQNKPRDMLWCFCSVRSRRPMHYTRRILSFFFIWPIHLHVFRGSESRGMQLCKSQVLPAGYKFIVTASFNFSLITSGKYKGIASTCLLKGNTALLKACFSNLVSAGSER